MRGQGQGTGGSKLVFRNIRVEDPRPTLQHFMIAMQGVCNPVHPLLSLIRLHTALHRLNRGQTQSSTDVVHVREAPTEGHAIAWSSVELFVEAKVLVALEASGAPHMMMLTGLVPSHPVRLVTPHMHGGNLREYIVDHEINGPQHYKA